MCYTFPRLSSKTFKGSPERLGRRAERTGLKLRYAFLCRRGRLFVCLDTPGRKDELTWQMAFRRRN